MRLLNVQTLDLDEFIGEDVPKYAILSHTWGREEVTLQEWVQWRQGTNPTISNKSGYQKIIVACSETISRGLSHCWVDTNCIDKTNSTELSEAINSMFAWYRDAEVCFVYLEDLDPSWEKLGLSRGPQGVSEDERAGDLARCRWFTRGWTLQELLAPRMVQFFNRVWANVGDKLSLAFELSVAAQINGRYLRDPGAVFEASIAQKMHWASRRKTSRIEDMAYCLMGIFDINMPLLYGEGAKAFLRLQGEIIKTSSDQSIFAWGWPQDWVPKRGWISFFAPSPAAFSQARDIVPHRPNGSEPLEKYSFTTTNVGLSISLSVLTLGVHHFALIACSRFGDGRLAIPVIRARHKSDGFVRAPKPCQPLVITHFLREFEPKPIRTTIGFPGGPLRDPPNAGAEDDWNHRYGGYIVHVFRSSPSFQVKCLWAEPGLSGWPDTWFVPHGKTQSLYQGGLLEIRTLAQERSVLLFLAAKPARWKWELNCRLQGGLSSSEPSDLSQVWHHWALGLENGPGRLTKESSCRGVRAQILEDPDTSGVDIIRPDLTLLPVFLSVESTIAG